MISKLFKKHYIAIICALFIGLLYIGPHIAFIFSLGDEYQGIPMLQTANEGGYLARIHEIIDGYWMVGSFPFYEYKSQMPLMPPTGEMFYAFPSFFLGISLSSVLIASKFILPFILFLLIYTLIYNLLIHSHSLSRKVSALSGAFFIVLGYDLVDYRSLINFFLGRSELGGDFLIWSRPVNPILGAIFLFSFLLGIWAIIQKTKYQKTAIGSSALFFALMIMSYFFSWGMALSILGVLVLIYIFKREYKIVAEFISVFALALVFSLPYWYMTYITRQSPLYNETALRTGLIYSHYPLFNKVLLLTLVIYFILVFIPIIKNILLKNNTKHDFQNWYWLCLAFVLGSFWAFNQQVITGMTAWPYHFVQYSIPLSMIVLVVLLYNVVFSKFHFRFVWIFATISIIGSSLLFGLYSQIHTYKNSYSYHYELQSYNSIFQWFNKKPKDCVILVHDERVNYSLNNLLLAFTHCNVYVSNEVFSLIPEERIYHNYLVTLRMKSISSEDIEDYVAENISEVRGYLFTNWEGVHGTPEFPDFFDSELRERIKKLPQDYKEFLKKDFREELNKYRLDYIMSVGPLGEGVIAQLNGLKLEYQDNDVFVYSFKD